MTAKRQVLLVPTDQDMSDPAYLEKYWPNFVCGVQNALRGAGIDAEIRVVGAEIHASITCPRCHHVSYNPHDIVNRYCGLCHWFHDDHPAPPESTQ